MSDMPQPTAPTSRRPALKWLLIASLALNVLVVGAVIGAMFRGGSFGGGRGAPQNIFGYVSSLPAERRQDLMKRAAGLRQEMRGLRQDSRVANKERLAAITAEPFDRERYIAAQTRQIEIETRIRMLMRNVVADTAAGMTLEERRAFIRWRPMMRGGSSIPDDLEVEPMKKP